MTALPVSPADVLRRAADLVDEGWCQGVFYREVDGRTWYCALGALDAVPLDAAEYNAVGIAEKALSRSLKGGISNWNDEPGQTAEAVSAKLRAVADNLENN